MIFTTILHSVRKHFGLSCNEYCVVELVFFGQNNPKSKLLGWCSLSRQEMANELDLSRQTIISTIKKLKEMGLVEENEIFFLRTTEKWFVAISSVRQETLPPVKKLDTLSNYLTPNACKETLPPPVKKLDTPHYKINILNNTTKARATRTRKEVEVVEVPNFVEEEKKELIEIVAKEENPPKVAPKSLPWIEIESELKSSAFVERAYFQTKQLLGVGQKNTDFVLSQIDVFRYVLQDEYPEGVESVKRAKDYFLNWLTKRLQTGVFETQSSKNKQTNGNPIISEKPNYEDVLTLINQRYFGQA